MPARVWKVGVLKTQRYWPGSLIGHKERKEELVRQLVNLHTLMSQAKDRLNQPSKDLTGSNIFRIKKQAKDDLNEVAREMKALRKEMRRRGMYF